MVDVGKIAKTSQEQAIAAWVDYLNQVRITDLIASLNQQDGNLQDALDSLRSTVETLQSNVIEIGRGGQRGMHGFIAEVAEVGIGNARKAVQGQERIYDWVNNNGPDDIRIGDVLYQMKFVQGGGSFSLDAVAKHLESYPDYLEAFFRTQGFEFLFLSQRVQRADFGGSIAPKAPVLKLNRPLTRKPPAAIVSESARVVCAPFAKPQVATLRHSWEK